MSCLSLNGRGWAATKLVAAPLYYSLKTSYSIVTTIIEGLSEGGYCDKAGYALKRNCMELTGTIAFYAIRIVNPKAKFEASPPISINHMATEAMSHYGFHCYRNGSDVLTKHVYSRLAIFGTMLLSLASRVIDIAIGILAFPCALLSRGKDEKLNSQSLQGFVAIGLCVSDVILGLINTIHPAFHIDKRMGCGYEAEV